MKSALIGYTGFVGSNLSSQLDFTDEYNSENIGEIAGKEYDMVLCSGIPASMWMANNFPEKDFQNIENLLNILRKVKAEYFIHISSIAVFKQPVRGVDETSCTFEKDLAYGKNRRYAEDVVSGIFSKHLIVRLPALFGEGLKKNLIYDFLNQEPAFMASEKFNEILDKLDECQKKMLREYYVYDHKKFIWVFDKEKAIKDNMRRDILDVLRTADFTALKFTHSESTFQFYCLDDLMKDINIALKNNLAILHLCSEPIKAKDIAKSCFNVNFENDNGNPPLNYDMKTKYAKFWNKTGDYQYRKDEVFLKLDKFIKYNQK